ncbi:hypothetical protein GEMRC1_000560 [Eukaryota sp. GEM-RC1]
MSDIKGRDPLPEEVSLHPDNLVIKKVIHAGDESSPSPLPGAKVFVHYTGTLENGDKFDSSRDRNDPFSFTIDQGMVIKGWDIAVKSLKIGERASFWIHYTLAYGESGSPPKIPGKSHLVFDIELLDFEPDYSSMEAEDVIEAASKMKATADQAFGKSDVQSAVTTWKKAVDALETVWLDESKESLSEGLKELQTKIELNLGLGLMKLNQARDAITHLDSVLEKMLKTRRHCIVKAKALLQLGDFTESKATVQKLLELDSESKEGKALVAEISRAEAKEQQRVSSLYKKMMTAL